MENGFVKGQSDNLPKLDYYMLGFFFAKNTDFMGVEVRGVKAGRSGRESYGDDAVGYVQVKRDGDVCTVKGRVTPEHKVRSTPYHCTLICNEKEEEIISVQCEDCAASRGGCKHAVAFMMWIHRRSEEPATTAVKCYWKKAALSDVGVSTKFIKAKDMGNIKKLPSLQEQNGLFLNKVVSHFKGLDNKIHMMNHFKDKMDVESLSIHVMACKFKQEFDMESSSAGDFLLFCRNKMNPKICADVNIATLEQADSKIWFELRYGRITASKAHEAAHCRTIDGNLVQAVMGAAKFKDNPAMARGRALESKVRARVEEIRSLNIKKCGLLLKNDIPIMGASPDGIADGYVIEIKCPEEESNLKNYVKDGSVIADKCYAQIQLQMLFANRQNGLFCVADPDFERTNKVDIIDVAFDENFCLNMIKEVENFWKKFIYNKVVFK